MAREYKIGDEVAINLGVESDPFKGEVVAILDLPGWMFLNYVISLETEMDPLLEVRSALNMSPWEAVPQELVPQEELLKE